VEEECSGWDLQRRLKAAGIVPLNLRVLHQAGARIDSQDWVDHLKRHMEGSKLVIMDPLSNLHGLDDREQSAMVTIWGVLGDLQRNSGCTLLVVHHTVKTSWVGDVPQLADIRGSSVIAGRLDWAYVLKPLILKERTEEPDEELQAVQDAKLFELHCVKMRGWAAAKPRVAELLDVKMGGSDESVPALIWQDATPKQVRRGQRETALRVRILAVCRNNECESANAIWKAAGTGRSDTLRLIKEMKASGELVVDSFTRLYKPQDSGSGTSRFRVVPSTRVVGVDEVVPTPLRGGTTRTTVSETVEKEEVVPDETGTSPTLKELSCIWANCVEPRSGGLAWCVKHWEGMTKPANGDPR
jgi:hypothetical protein